MSTATKRKPGSKIEVLKREALDWLDAHPGWHRANALSLPLGHPARLYESLAELVDTGEVLTELRRGTGPGRANRFYMTTETSEP
jgi:hypothetical protein